jgi:hypothetical protein
MRIDIWLVCMRLEGLLYAYLRFVMNLFRRSECETLRSPRCHDNRVLLPWPERMSPKLDGSAQVNLSALFVTPLSATHRLVTVAVKSS